jgi:hypothetical protein
LSADFEFITKHNAITTPDYCFEIDEYRRQRAGTRGGDQLLLAHISVARWSPSVCKRIDQQWVLFRQCVTAPLFACAEVADDKWERFVSRLGFKPYQLVTCENGELRRLFIHTT